MEFLFIKGIVNSDSELKTLLKDNFVTVFLDDNEIKDDILFEPLKYITIVNYNNKQLRIVFTDTNHDTDIYEIVDVIDYKNEFDLENFGERHKLNVEFYYPLYFCAIYKEDENDFTDILTILKKRFMQIESAKIVKYIEEVII